MSTNCETITKWAKKIPEMGPAVYRLTNGEKEHKHAYHIFSPWSPDGSQLVLARYNRVCPEADICVMDTATGEMKKVGVSEEWNAHNVAFQHWIGEKSKIIYWSRGEASSGFTTVNSDGTDEKQYSLKDFRFWYASSDGKYVYGTTPIETLCPDDVIATRDDKGVLRYNLETDEMEMILSLDDALALCPNAKEWENCHLYAKMLLIHKKSGRIMFNLTNTFWDIDGKEPRIRCLITMDADGSNPAYLGELVHHPNWHTIEDKVICNLRDFNEKLRFGFYNGDGSGLVDYVPKTTGSGHPTLSPDGKWICTDGKCGEGFDDSLILCDPLSGKELYIATFTAVSEGYPSFKAIRERKEGETVIGAITKSKKVKCWQTQAHPAWSRDGSAILFNRDAGDGKGSQLYMVDVEETVAALT